MNSNFRETFGIIDKETGEQYPDIIYAFLLTLRITEEDKKAGKIQLEDGTNFLLQIDGPVRREIIGKGYCDCLVSFQTRTDCKIALARKLRN